MSRSYDIERTEQGLDIEQASARIRELELSLMRIRGLATWWSAKSKGEIYAESGKALGLTEKS